MRTETKWKQLVNEPHTISYEKQYSDYRIIIEARNHQGAWEVIKKYVGEDINFSETYNAETTKEVTEILTHLRNEQELSKRQINTIHKFNNKPLKIQLKRAYKTSEVEKWNFEIDSSFANMITIYYGEDQLYIDIVMQQQLKYVEEKVVAKLYETLSIDHEDAPIRQHIYYYSKKSDYYLESVQDEVDVEFIFE